MKRAIISVYYKSELSELVSYLDKNNYQIYSTGGTFTHITSLVESIDSLINISDYTNSPEICNGRVKTLHPKIFGGILGDRNNDTHKLDLNKIRADFFDLVVVNLYPFSETLSLTDDQDKILEQIDIGGHTLIRAAVKNYKDITVLTHPNQYKDFITERYDNLYFAKKAIEHIMKYDIAINNWFNQDVVGHSYKKVRELKYGLNPYMKPCYVYLKDDNENPITILNGNPGYINLLDANNAIRLVLETKLLMNRDCCASFKHNSPAGVASTNTLSDLEKELYKPNSHDSLPEATFLAARNIDPKSSFGDMIAYSGVVDMHMAIRLKKYVSDGIIAYDYNPAALDILKTKKKGKYVILKQQHLINQQLYRDVNGTTLVQPSNDSFFLAPDNTNLPDYVITDMQLGYITLKYTQSNSVCYVYKGRVIGIGSGQQNRVDCVELAGNKANEWLSRHKIEQAELTLVSDAFFPFPDNIDVANKYNVKYIAQPGGSIRDKLIEKACQKYKIKMVYTNLRAFTH